MSRSTRITLFLIIDVLVFFAELIFGCIIGSLALVADSFHVLSDIMSLFMALYAIKLTGRTSHDSRYSYGWHRAEILAALVNGVFLLALCLSISLEAFQRFSSIPKISNPRFIVIVGSLGLASNLVGLFLFHEHGHSHDHSHGAKIPSSSPSSIPASATGLISGEVARTPSFSSLYDHPAATRVSLVQTASEMTSTRSPSPSDRVLPRSHISLDITGHVGTSIEKGSGGDSVLTPHTRVTGSKQIPLVRHSDLALRDSRSHSSPSSKHTHSHAGSMNMRALVLHVLGDAMGNIGVIITGLIIWLTSWNFKYYCDPIISLVIAVIIFLSALPLVRSASFILLQGVPATVSLDKVRNSILNVEGVLSLHDLHIWQLSETKVIASVHVTACRSDDFMLVAAMIRKALHGHGIHSSTIQPEYYANARSALTQELKTSMDTSCLILCPPDQECNPLENACCPPPLTNV